MRPHLTVLSDKLLLAGWACVALSAVLFCLPLWSVPATGDMSGFFMAHYLLALAYFFSTKFSNTLYREEHHLHYRFITLVLFLISAYSLNRDINLFAASSTWFSVLQVVVCINFLLGVFFKHMPERLRLLSLFIDGVSLVVFIYLAAYLMPVYLFSIFALIAIGISIHSFVPLFFVYYIIRRAGVQAQGIRLRWVSFASGIAVSLLVCVWFVIGYAASVKTLNKTYLGALQQDRNDLPTWVKLAQETGRDGISEAVLKTGLIYRSFPLSGNLFWNVPDRSFGEEKIIHDPLVIMGAFFSGPLLVPEEERIRVLETVYNARHQTLERLWSGEDLKTSHVSTSVKVWPEMHLAYTEKLITVHNHSRYQFDQQEAIYTLHMPEGAVVTSLSLWIEGKEEKAMLTSKRKAATAYNTIVGRERRDPSVVHWQEGNTVNVRVFPVPGGGSRTFKLGITAPLRNDEGQLAYDNTWFEGPSASGAEETVRIEMLNHPKTFVRQASFSAKNHVFTAKRKYKPVWTLYFDDVGLRPHAFSFNGHSYRMLPYQKQRVPVKITDVYLDISSTWSEREAELVWDVVKGKRIWAFDGEMKLVTAENVKDVFKKMRKLQFTLFPFHLVGNREQALVVTKSSGYSPRLNELEGSLFLEKLKQGLAGEQRVRLYHIGQLFSPYIRSLKEFRRFDFECGSVRLLQDLLRNEKFVRDAETAEQVIIHSANLVIAKTKGELPSTGPDHLMRLFAYNDIMRQRGKAGLTGEGEDEELLMKAEEAYVVSPVSSLVVLEKKSDYDRFDIKENVNSLKNASMGNKGAVPEPHEWALIIIAAAIFLFFLFKWKMI